MTSWVGWACCGLGVACCLAVALGSQFDLFPLRSVLALLALAVMFFGAGVLAAVLPEGRRRAARATHRAFALGRQFEQRRQRLGDRIKGDGGRGAAA